MYPGPMKNRKSGRTKQRASAKGLQRREPVINKVHPACTTQADAVVDKESQVVNLERVSFIKISLFFYPEVVDLCLQ